MKSHRLSSPLELVKLQEILLKKQAKKRITITVSGGTCGFARGSAEVVEALKENLRENHLDDEVYVKTSGCLGFCEREPIVLIHPDKIFYIQVKPGDAKAIVNQTIKDKQIIEKLLYRDPLTKKIIYHQSEIPFYANQMRLLFGKNEYLDPTSIEDYIAIGGYQTLSKVLSSMKPERVIEEITKSGLRGRGGGGFPTGKKWAICRDAEGDTKFIICNADEGDPGAFMDRALLEGNPHSVIEGMIIGAFAIDSHEGFIYVRNEYPLAVKVLGIAIEQAREYGLLEDNILGSVFKFDIGISRGGGAFVCGEETGLMSSIEGKIGDPYQRPPYPVHKGLWGYPTVINNVETWASTTKILEKGGDWFSKIGIAGSKGSKVFALTGKVNNTGLVEVPMGIKLRDIIFKIGGGIPESKKFKAVQTGGPSGGCIPSSLLDLPIDYESLVEAGSIMGSGGMVVMDENTCMVDVARYFLNFTRTESCGKCTPCREGNNRMYQILTKIAEGNGTMEDLELLEELANIIKNTALCGLGKTAPNPFISTLRYFRDEYKQHIIRKRCDSFVCKGLVGAPCQSACPIGTEAWRYIAHIARGEFIDAYRVIRESNPFPSICGRVCDHQCEIQCKLGKSGSQPVAIRALKRFITDNVNPSAYKLKRTVWKNGKPPRIAIIGAGPGGLTAAHYLSLKGYKIDVYDAEEAPGGMLIAGIPEYRLPHQILQKEIASLIDNNITLHCNVKLGDDITLEGLFATGYQAVFLAMGAHQSRRLGLENEDAEGVYPSMQFLKEFNIKGNLLAHGKVGIIGGGNSAIDAARVAIREPGVNNVTVFYRRGRDETPAFPHEVSAALEEGVMLEVQVSPIRINTKDGRLASVDFIRNEYGEPDESGRYSFIPIPGTEFNVHLDTLIIAIGEQPHPFIKDSLLGIEFNKNGTIIVNEETLLTARSGVFAGGDAITGPSTVVKAIAAGKRAALMIDRYIKGNPLKIDYEPNIPKFYIEPLPVTDERLAFRNRVNPTDIPADVRRKSFVEMELCLNEVDAMKEAQRCLRCDLEFTKPK